MSAFLFPVYVLAHLATFCSAVYLGRKYSAAGAWWVALIAGALVYDNLIVSLGTTLGIGELLKTLSWPRFVMHALGTPFLMVAALQVARVAGVGWAQKQAWQITIWVLVVAMVGVGVYEGLIGLEIYPTCFDGILRYTANVNPGHLCFEGQEVIKAGGPPIPAIVGNIVTLIVGVSLWRVADWSWLLLGALAMFVAAGMPFSVFGMAPSNGGEVLLLFAFTATVARFRQAGSQKA